MSNDAAPQLPRNELRMNTDSIGRIEATFLFLLAGFSIFGLVYILGTAAVARRLKRTDHELYDKVLPYGWGRFFLNRFGLLDVTRLAGNLRSRPAPELARIGRVLTGIIFVTYVGFAFVVAVSTVMIVTAVRRP
jgi:hypothetical protein